MLRLQRRQYTVTNLAVGRIPRKHRADNLRPAQEIQILHALELKGGAYSSSLSLANSPARYRLAFLFGFASDAPLLATCAGTTEPRHHHGQQSIDRSSEGSKGTGRETGAYGFAERSCSRRGRSCRPGSCCSCCAPWRALDAEPGSLHVRVAETGSVRSRAALPCVSLSRRLGLALILWPLKVKLKLRLRAWVDGLVAGGLKKSAGASSAGAVKRKEAWLRRIGLSVFREL